MARVQRRLQSGFALAGVALMSLTLLTLGGCAAGRGTYFLAKSVEPLATTRESDAPDLAIFAWTMADEYRRKSWDEWCSSDYEQAEHFSKLAVEWSEKARSIAAAGGAVQLLDEQVTMDQVRRALAALQGTAPPEVGPPQVGSPATTTPDADPDADEEGLQ